MIPNLIWQTYKTPMPPECSWPLIKTWLQLNPQHQWYYMDDNKCQSFIKDHFSDEFYQMYVNLPFGVMRADVWRVAVIYIYGGVYADIDTACYQSVEKWISPEFDLVLGIENPRGDINNFVFAAAPQHPALLKVLNFFLELYNSPCFLDKNSPTPIQDFGAGAWSNGLLKYFNLEEHKELGADFFNTVASVKKHKTFFYSYDSRKFHPTLGPDTAVLHHSGSIFWNDQYYESWRKQQYDKFGVFGR